MYIYIKYKFERIKFVAARNPKTKIIIVPDLGTSTGTRKETVDTININKQSLWIECKQTTYIHIVQFIDLNQYCRLHG